MTNDATLDALIRDVPDFPKPGILFKDITPLLADAVGFARTTELLSDAVAPHKPDALVGIESRGFIFGAALSHHMKLPLQLVRKTGKLPHEKIGIDYDLEYGSDRVEMHTDAVSTGKRYAIIDDLIATGGTAAASCELIETHGGVVCCLAFVIELVDLPGRGKLGDRPVTSLLSY